MTVLATISNALLLEKCIMSYLLIIGLVLPIPQGTLIFVHTKVLVNFGVYSSLFFLRKINLIGVSNPTM